MFDHITYSSTAEDYIRAQTLVVSFSAADDNRLDRRDVAKLTFRSLWTMCFWWQYCTADTICGRKKTTEVREIFTQRNERMWPKKEGGEKRRDVVDSDS